MKTSLVFLFAFSAFWVESLGLRFTRQANAKWPKPSRSYLGEYTRAAVAADHGLCSEIGRNALLRGGTAVDAIIATNICQGALSPQSSGIGGGMFITYYDRKKQTCTTIDGREAAPQAVDKLNANNTRFGWRSIGVPGEISAMYEAHQRWGRLKWYSLFAPTIKYLRDGYPVSGHLAYSVDAEYVKADVLEHLDLFVNKETGQPVDQGHILRRPRLATTLSLLANSKDPVGVFYKGWIGQALVREIRHNGGVMTYDDFKNYKARVIETPVIMDIPNSNLVLCGPPPPSSAAVVAGMLNIISGFDIKPSDFLKNETTGEVYHRIIESMKFAYAIRSQLGDREFSEVAAGVVKNITSKQWGETIRGMIKPQSAPDAEYYGGNFVQDGRGTSPMSAMDQEGNAVSVISSINWFFGSRRRAKNLGIVWNNHVSDFGFPGVVDGYGLAPGAENLIEAGKRPMSSMSPIVLYDKQSGDAIMTIGAEGGSRIISSVAYVATRVLYFNETIKQAVDAPRIHNQLTPYKTEHEPQFPPSIVKILREKHNQRIEVWDEPEWDGSVVCGVHRHSDGTLMANSDHRKPGGYPAGF